MPDLGSLRLIGGGPSLALLQPDASVLWWCAPDIDDAPLCWQLLDPDGGVAYFPGHQMYEASTAPAGRSARTLLRKDATILEVVDTVVPLGGGVALVRLLRLAAPGEAAQVQHALRLGGLDSAAADFRLDGSVATASQTSRGRTVPVQVHADAHRLEGGEVHSSVTVRAGAWSPLVIAVDCSADLELEGAALAAIVESCDAEERAVLDAARLPRPHPERARDALAVLRACTYEPTGAVVAAATTSLPEAVGNDRQFDYRFSWLRDASLSTAVAALLGRPDDARRYLGFVHHGWGEGSLLDRPVLDVRGRPVPAEREVAGASGWGASVPIRVGNGASGQRQYDSPGLLMEAVSVYLQVGGRLDDATWRLVKRVADETATQPDRALDSNGIWELRERAPLVDGDIGRWLVLDRALWIARGWRPWTSRRSWKAARAVVARRVLDAIGPDGLLPQSYGQSPPQVDASSLMVVAFGLLARDDPRAARLVDGVLQRLGSGPFLYRYPPEGADGFVGREGAFLPMSFLAVTALATLGRVEQAEHRLNALCGTLPRLLSEEVDPQSGRLLGNTPLVWSHAELARALYVLDAAQRRQRWGRAGLSVWRLWRYLLLRSAQDRSTDP